MLFLFIIMMLDIKISEEGYLNFLKYIPFNFFIGFIFLNELFWFWFVDQNLSYSSFLSENLNLQLGYSHDSNFKIPKDIKIIVEKQTTIKINGADKQQVGMVASQIKSLRATEPYKGKGIKEKGEYILRKEGKKK